MKRRGRGRTREITVGITLTLALAILAGFILLLGEESRMFHSKHKYVTNIINSQGLKSGSPVVMGGVQIGAITSVELPKEVRGEGIDIEMSVDRTYGERVREGSLASLGFITLLSGEKFINISQGDPERPQLPDGAFIPLDKSETLLETGQSVAENLAAVSKQLRDVLAQVGEGEGLLGQIIRARDPYFGQQLVEKLDKSLGRTSQILDRVEGGQGTIGRLLVDRQYADETLGAIRSAAARMDRLLEAVETKNGALGELIREDGEGKQVIADLRATSTSLRGAAAKLESSSGIVGRLLNDPEYSEAIAQDLRTITKSLSSIAEKVDRGEGSLGGIINDPEVYQGLKDIVAGIRKSRMGRALLRHYGRKGAKDEPKTPAGGPSGGTGDPGATGNRTGGANDAGETESPSPGTGSPPSPPPQSPPIEPGTQPSQPPRSSALDPGSQESAPQSPASPSPSSSASAELPDPLEEEGVCAVRSPGR